MTRLIAGALRSMPVAVPPVGTRPTTDRVREALFSAIDARLDLEGVAVLDLFAGSGALGLEALSRGAGTADLVDSSAAAARVLERNAEEARRRLDKRPDEVRVRRGTLPDLVAGPCPRAGGYDLVLVDPPYDIADEVLPDLLRRLVAENWLSEIAHVVCESSNRGGPLEWPDGLVQDLDRGYGETRVRLGVVG